MTSRSAIGDGLKNAIESAKEEAIQETITEELSKLGISRSEAIIEKVRAADGKVTVTVRRKP